MNLHLDDLAELSDGELPRSDKLPAGLLGETEDLGWHESAVSPDRFTYKVSLAQRSPKQQARIMCDLRFHRKLARSFKVSNGRPTLTVPREPATLAAALVGRLKREEKGLHTLLNKPSARDIRADLQARN